MTSSNTLKRVVSFEKLRVTKADWEDAECSNCRYVFGYKRGGEFAYVISQDNHGGLQLCQECFDKLDEVKPNSSHD